MVAMLEIVKIFFADYYRVYDYALGLPQNELGKEQLGIKKLDANGDAVWETSVGCENKAFWYFVHGVSTPDGGVIASTTTQWGGGDITNYYGWNDAWVVKIDSLGRLEWETTLGTENSEFPDCFINASGGGYYVGISGNPGYVGSIPVCRVPSTDEFDALFIKLDTDGILLWSRCYGGSKWDAIVQIVELEDRTTGMSKEQDIISDISMTTLIMAKLMTSGLSAPILTETLSGAAAMGGQTMTSLLKPSKTRMEVSRFSEPPGLLMATRRVHRICISHGMNISLQGCGLSASIPMAICYGRER